MSWLEPITLSGASVRLEPLDHRHKSDLIEAVKDGELWRLWYTSIPAPEKMEAEITRRRGLQASGSMLPFAVIDLASGKAGGNDDLHERGCRQQALGNWIDLVSPQRAAHADQQPSANCCC